jgi:protein phosphatase
MSEAPAQLPVEIEISARTDVGCVREQNEDSWLVADLSAGRRGLLAEVERHVVGARGTLLAVCDGMGGAAAGEVASALAADVIYEEMAHAPESAGDRAIMGRLLRRAVRAANLRVHEESKKQRGRRGMGTTLSAGFVWGGALVLAQVGDSRAYLWRSGTLVQLTRDQSGVSALVQAGRLTAEEAKGFIGANVILQALGVDEDVEVSLSLAELRQGDVLLICSDGLTGPVNDESVRAALAAHENVGEATRALIDAARAGGGPDNVTVVLARFLGEGLPPPGGEADLPRFVEFDPMEEGERAITTTSRVARRLAARAGMGDDTPVKAFPPTGQHTALTDADAKVLRRPPRGGKPGRGRTNGVAQKPAEAALAHRSRLSTGVLLLAALAAVAVGALVLLRC